MGDWVAFKIDLVGLHSLDGVNTLRSGLDFEELANVGALINFGESEKLTRLERVEGAVEPTSRVPEPPGV